ncbi:phage regulatory CII family protein [Haliea salexigens]|uniref:phage regulatory CII family protein n=1 Tax=Haliea salexigens TaxID=287487 RepID=UPI0004079AC1|nr:phage regulatory CII family protein [Haliea salexigens]
MQQITLNYDAGLVDSYQSCREFVAYRAHHQQTSQKALAADMDYSPSDLTRKLAQSPNDSRRFTLDDLEKFIEVTGDTSPVMYLVEKYLTESNRIAELEAELNRLKRMKGVA